MTAELWLLTAGTVAALGLALWLFWTPMCDGIEAILTVMVDG